MASNTPGRRVSYGETFYTDWRPRGGDCAILRAQALSKSSSSGTVDIGLETRSAEGTCDPATETSDRSSAPKLLTLNALGERTAVYTATTRSNSQAQGFKDEVRFRVAWNGGSAGDYYVIRLFPPVFFDNSVPGS